MRDFRNHGEALWSRFKAGRDGMRWYYHRLLQIYRIRQTQHLEGLVDDLSRSLDELYGRYKMFGEDPFIKTDDPSADSFSAWDYAKKRSPEICRGKPS